MAEDYLSVQVHNEFAKRLDEENRRQNNRLDLLERNLEETKSLAISVEKLALSLENMVNEQKKQGERLAKLEEEPKNNYDKIKWIIITAIVGVIIGAVAVHLGLK